jgi:phage gp36-like protein
MATPYLVIEDFNTHIYNEIIAEIIRGDADIADKAIQEAIALAKSYLSRFNLVQLFGTESENPVVKDENLKARVKDIAVWRMVRLANPNLTIEIARANYEDAIAWLKDVQSGKADPEGWPYKEDDAATNFSEGNTTSIISKPTRINNY